jgi:ribosomal protein L20A (L18A)
MKTFNLTGEIRLGSRWNKFSKDIAANDEDHAKELLFARFGSKHKLPRRFINLLEVSESGQSTVLQAPKSNTD